MMTENQNQNRGALQLSFSNARIRGGPVDEKIVCDPVNDQKIP